MGKTLIGRCRLFFFFVMFFAQVLITETWAAALERLESGDYGVCAGAYLICGKNRPDRLRDNEKCLTDQGRMLQTFQ